MSEQLRTPLVPAELEELLDETTLEANERWQRVRRDELLKTMPDPMETSFGAAVILKPKEEQTTPTTVVALPQQQNWNPSTYARVSYMQDVVVPGSQVVVLPNSPSGVRPLFENSARILESIGIEDEIYATGHLMGGIAVLGLAGVMSDKFDVRLVNADEVPNRWRSSKDQGMMETSFKDLLIEAGNRRSGIAIKLGYIVGSRLVDEELLLSQGYSARCNGSRVRIQPYTRDTTQRYGAVDKNVTNALMFKQALELLPLKPKS